MHLYSAFIVYCHTPKALYNHVGGHSSTTTSEAFQGFLVGWWQAGGATFMRPDCCYSGLTASPGSWGSGVGPGSCPPWRADGGCCFGCPGIEPGLCRGSMHLFLNCREFVYEQGRDRCQCYRSNAEVLERWMKCCFSVRDAPRGALTTLICVWPRKRPLPVLLPLYANFIDLFSVMAEVFGLSSATPIVKTSKQCWSDQLKGNVFLVKKLWKWDKKCKLQVGKKT